MTWTPTTELLVDPARLHSAVDRSARTHHAPTQAAAATWWKAYAYWAARPAVTAWVRTGTSPDMAATNTEVRLSAGPPFVDVRALDPTPLPPPPAGEVDGAWLRRVVDHHLVPVGELVAEVYRVGRRNVWGSILSGLAHLLTEAHDRVDPTTAEAVLAAAGSPYPDLVELVELVDRTGRSRPYPLRRTCCLAFRGADARVCTGCPLRDDASRTRLTAERGLTWRRRTPLAAG